ncbi:hypothetical protein D3C81_1879430 [compost metagenome]
MPQPEQKRQLNHHKQRPDNQPRHIIDKRRFAPFIVVTDKLDNPANHKHRHATAQPDQRALLRQDLARPNAQPQQRRHQHPKAQLQAQVEPRRRQRDQHRR